MLLRNLDAPKLCNGTRLVVKELMPHVIKAIVLSGSAKGEEVLIPKIPLITSSSDIQLQAASVPSPPVFCNVHKQVSGPNTPGGWAPSS